MAEEFEPPSHERLTFLALRVLEEALAEKERGKVKRTTAHRLALGWLAHQGIGLEWHYKLFWDALADEHLQEEKESYREMFRTRELTSLLDFWWYAIGREPPSLTERARWADKRTTAPAISSPASPPAAAGPSPEGG